MNIDPPKNAAQHLVAAGPHRVPEALHVGCRQAASLHCGGTLPRLPYPQTRFSFPFTAGAWDKQCVALNLVTVHANRCL